MKLAQFFARKAEQKLGEGTVMKNKRTLERLLRESRKVKEVYSEKLEREDQLIRSE
jgi:molecular chaperone DnaK (HSP70)